MIDTVLFENTVGISIHFIHFALFCSPVAASYRTFSLPFATATMYHTVVLSLTSLTLKTCVCRQSLRLLCSSISIVPGRSKSLEKNHIHCTLDTVATPYCTPPPPKYKCWCALNACENEQFSKEWRAQSLAGRVNLSQPLRYKIKHPMIKLGCITNLYYPCLPSKHSTYKQSQRP